jgi:hypothetical protein
MKTIMPSNSDLRGVLVRPVIQAQMPASASANAERGMAITRVDQNVS